MWEDAFNRVVREALWRRWCGVEPRRTEKSQASTHEAKKPRELLSGAESDSIMCRRRGPPCLSELASGTTGHPWWPPRRPILRLPGPERKVIIESILIELDPYPEMPRKTASLLPRFRF